MSKDTTPTTLRGLMIHKLHQFDHEPDEITKYVVIDQTEFVPETARQIQEQLKALLPEKMPMKVMGDATPEISYKHGYVKAHNQALDQIEKAIEEWTK